MGGDRDCENDPVTRPLAWRNAVFALFFTMGFGFSSWMSRLPWVRDSLDATTRQMGFMLLGISIGSVLGLTVASHVIHRFEARRVVTVGLTVVSLGFALAAWAASAGVVAGIVAGFVVAGLTTGMSDVAANVSAAANERAVAKPIMPVFHAFFSFGTVAGAGFGALSAALGIGLGWQASIVALIMITVAVVSYRHLAGDATPEDGSSVTLAERLAVWRDPTTLLLGLLVLGMALTEGSANDWMSLLMVDGHGFSEVGGALAFALFLTAMTAGRLLGVPLLANFGRVPVLRSTAVLAAVGLLLVILVDHQVVALIGTALWGLGASLGFPVGMSAAADDQRLATARVGTVSTIGYLAFLAGPPMLGLLGEQWGLRNAMFAVLIFVLLSGLTASVAREKYPKS